MSKCKKEQVRTRWFGVASGIVSGFASACSGVHSEYDDLGESKQAVVANHRSSKTLPERQQAVRDHFQRKLDQLDIAETTVTPEGQVVDWVPRLEIGAVAPPPREVDDEHQSQWSTTFFQRSPEAKGPPGTVPRVRFDVEEYLTRVGDKVPDDPSEVVWMDHPASESNRRYYNQYALSANGSGNKSAYWGGAAQIEMVEADDKPPSGTGQITLGQIALRRGDNTIEVGKIEVGSNPSLSLFTYFTTNEYTAEGSMKGGYNANDAFVQMSSSVSPGMLLSGSGYLQVEIVHQIPGNNWWIWANGEWVGFYTECYIPFESTMNFPAACGGGTQYLFDSSGLRTQGQLLAVYGEVSIATVNVPESTDMGDGTSAGAFMRNIRVLPKGSQVGQPWGVSGVPFGSSNGAGRVTGVQQATWGQMSKLITDVDCYNMSDIVNVGFLGNNFNYGGDGSDASGCN